MANNIDPIGAVLQFGEDITRQLGEIDKKLVDMYNSSDKAADRIESAFRKATEGGLSSFQKGIFNVMETLEKLDGRDSLSGLSQGLQKSIKDVTSLVTTLQSATEAMVMLESTTGMEIENNTLRKIVDDAIKADASIAKITTALSTLDQVVTTHTIGSGKGMSSVSLSQEQERVLVNYVDILNRRLKEKKVSDIQILESEEALSRKMIEKENIEASRIIEAKRLQYEKTMEYALKMKSGASSVNELRNAISLLQQAMDNLNSSDSRYFDRRDFAKTKIEEAEAEVSRLTQDYSKQEAAITKLYDKKMRLELEINKIEKSPSLRSLETGNENEPYSREEITRLKDAKRELSEINAQIAHEKVLYGELARTIEATFDKRKIEEFNKAEEQYRNTAQSIIDRKAKEEEKTGDMIDKLMAEERKYEALIAELETEKATIERLQQNGINEEGFSSEKVQALEIYKSKLNEVRQELQAQAKDEAEVYAKRKEDNSGKEIENRIRIEERRKKAVDDATRAIDRHAKAEQEAYRITAKGSIEYSKSANTIEERRRALSYMETAITKLDTKESNFKTQLGMLNNEIKRQKGEIEKLIGVQNVESAAITEQKNKTKELKNENEKLFNTTQQLKSVLRSLFSISQIKNFIEGIANLRGEFELQHKALSVIIQDEQEADRLWTNITQLAVESPFRVKQLVTYTKQLAAYRIETENLFDVTKRLADVSSGLGVDMDRLILAYGQVKAANYLRGQELRQFSEAGINILGELADKFSEVEGRTVRVGEVFDMVSKRMVKFQDVEEIFEKMTNEGGIFFEMQEKQAETLKGQLSNLKDSYDLMRNSIGESNQVLITKVISLLKLLIDNWRKVSTVVVPILGFLTARWAVLGVEAAALNGKLKSFFANITRNTRALLLHAISLKKNEKNAAKARAVHIAYNRTIKEGTTLIQAYSAAILAVASVILAAARIYKESQRVHNELNKIEKEGADEAVLSIDKYKRLADVVRDETASYEQQQDALKKLKAQYGDILPAHMLELDALKQMSNSYEEATAAITEYTMAKTREKQMDFISNELANDKRTNTNIIQTELGSALGTIGQTASKNDAIYAKSIIDRKILDGDIKTMKQFKDEILRIASEISGRNIEYFQAWYEKGDRYFRTMLDYAERLNSVNDINNNKGYIANRMLADAMDTANKSGNDMIKSLSNIKELSDKGMLSIEKYGAQLNAFNDYVNEMKEYVKDIPSVDSLSDADKLDEHKLALSEMADVIRSIGTEGKTVLDIVEDPLLSESLKQSVKQFELFKQGANFDPLSKSAERLNKEIDKLALGEREKQVRNLIEETAELYNVPISKFEGFMITSDEEMEEYVKKIKGHIDDMRNNVAMFQQGVIAINHGINDEEQANEITNLANAFEYMFEHLALVQKKGGSGTQSKKDKIPERISLIRDMNKEYEKLIENYSKEEAHEKVMESFKDSWNDIMGGKYAMDDFFMSGEGVVRKLEELKPEAVAEKTIGKLEKAISDENVEIGIDVRVKNRDLFKKDIENMFSELDINEEIEKLGIPKALAEELFGLESVNLEDIRRKIMSEKEKQNGAFVGSEGTKLYMEYLDKIDGMEQKQQTERLKSYVKYLREAMEERVKIEYEGLKEINDINKLYESGRIGENERDVMIEGSRKATSEKMQKQVWEDFKGSDTYIKLFQDLDSQSSKALEHMRKKLKEMGDSMHDLNPTDLRNLQEQIEKLDDEINKRHPLKALIESIKEVKALDSRDNLVEKLIGGEEEESRLQAIVDKLQVAQQMMMNGADGMDVDSKIAEIFPSNIDTTYGNMVDSTNLELVLKMYLELLMAQKKENNNTKTQINSWDKLVDSARTYATEWKKAFDTVKSAGGDVFSMVEALGGANDEADKAFMDVFNAIIDIIAIIPTYVAGMTAAGVAINSAMGIIGLVAEAITLITGLVTATAKLHDAKIEDEINGIRDEVDGLTGAYEDLEREMDRAWDLSKMRATSEEMRYNLQMQIDATERMMAAERKKKDSDEEQLKSWNQDIKDLTRQLEDERQRFIEESGGIGETNYLSAAEEYTSAWLEAFRETGDGLTGLEEHWDEYFDNLIKRQMTLRLAQASLGKLFEQVDNALANDGELSTEEAEAIDKLKNEALADFNEKMEMAAAQFGWGDSSESALSDLTESIQGMSEQEAEVIAGYLNSVRFFTGDSNAAIRSLTDALLSSSDGANPILDELRRQTAMITAIRDALTATVTDGMSRGKGIRVYMQ